MADLQDKHETWIHLYDASGQWGIFVSQTFCNKTLSFTCWATGIHPALFVCCLYELKLKLQ